MGSGLDSGFRASKADGALIERSALWRDLLGLPEAKHWVQLYAIEYIRHEALGDLRVRTGKDDLPCRSLGSRILRSALCSAIDAETGQK